MLRGSQPLTWSPHGCTDAIDSSQSFPGCMTALTNLIPDPSTSDVWMCRPAATQLTNFPTFNTPGFISCGRIVGNYFYGLMRTNRTPGFEEPFVWDLANNVVIAITGVTGLNVPAQAATSGVWVPPIMDVIGSKVMVCHPGFSATAFKFGWFDISNLAAITWNAGNTTGGIVLATIPTFVSQFNGRAYYIVNTAAQPAVVFSDPLAPTVVTNASQVLTFGDAVPLTCIGQLRLYNQSGGIIQALMVFKSTQNTYQVTGDSALSTLAVNALSVATGTNSPLGIAPTPKGLAFISPDGLRIIDFQGNISDVIGQDGKGVTIPFIYSNVPSRMTLSSNGSALRITTQNANALNTPFQEWWFDLGRGTWSGPHTSAMNLLESYNLSFVGQLQASGVGLWQSDIVQGAASTFTENALPLTWSYKTSLFPDTQQMSNVSLSQALLHCAMLANTTYNVTISDANETVLNSVVIALPGNLAIWGAFTWGVALWGSPGGALGPRIIPWTKQNVFAKARITVSGSSNSTVRLGMLHMRYKILKYLTNLGAVG